MTEQDSGWRQDEAPQHVEQAGASLSPVSPGAQEASSSERPPSSSQPAEPQRYGFPDQPPSALTWPPASSSAADQAPATSGYQASSGANTPGGYPAQHGASDPTPAPSGYPAPYSTDAPSGYPTPNSTDAPSRYPAPNSTDAPSGYPAPNSADARSGYPAQDGTGYPAPSGSGYTAPGGTSYAAPGGGGFASPAGSAGSPGAASGAGYPPPGGYNGTTGSQPTVQQPADPHHMWSRPGAAPVTAPPAGGYSTGTHPTVNLGGAPQPVSGPTGMPTSGGPDAYPTAAYPAGGTQPAANPTSGYPGPGPAGGYPTASYPGQPLPGYTGSQPSPGGPGGPDQPGGYPVAGYPGNYGPGQTTTAPKRSRGGLIALIIVVALILTVGSGTIGGFIAHRSNSAGGTQVVRESVPDVSRDSVAGIADKLLPSVVDITTDQGEGSGVVMTSDGSIVTNNHVVEGATGNTVNVTFSSGKTAKATIVGTDPAGDIAVIKAQGVSGLAAATFGDSDGMRVGDTVLAIGSPLGLQGSVSEGIISALHRTISEGSEGGQSATRSISDALQTDAAINPGNSGGALINLNGQVIGINTAIATSGQGSSSGNIGVGFAISSNRVKSAADQLSKGGKVSHPYLGVGLTDGQTGGALIANVVSGGPADKAGLQKGDVVMQADGKDVADSTALINAVQGHKVGDQLQLSIQRNGAQQQVTVTLGETPQ